MTVLIYFYYEYKTRDGWELILDMKSFLSFIFHWSTWLFILILAVIAFFSEKITEPLKTSQASILPTNPFPAEKIQYDPEIHLLFVGDISLQERGHSLGMDAFKGVQDLLSSADLVVGNLESPLTNTNMTAYSKGKWGGSVYLKGDPSRTKLLKDAGFDLMCLGNNHIGDYRMQGIQDTLIALKSNGLAGCGAGMNLEEACQPAFFVIKGRQIAFYAFCDVEPKSYRATVNQPGLAPARLGLIRKTISSQPVEVFVVVMFHWGVEMRHALDFRQEMLARTAIEAGADLVIGHHPHVVQKVSYIKGVPVAYSLGNFLFDTNQSAGELGMALLVTLIPSSNDLKLEIVPITNRNLHTQLALGKEAQRVLSRAVITTR